jgi:hypothetical protein
VDKRTLWWRGAALAGLGSAVLVAWACGGDSGDGDTTGGSSGGTPCASDAVCNGGRCVLGVCEVRDAGRLEAAPSDSSGCGALDQACCVGGACAATLRCGDAGTCVAPTTPTCGASGQVCCPNNTCSAGLNCFNNLCRSGETGTPCTKNADCTSGQCLAVGYATSGAGEPPGADAGSGNVCTTSCTGGTDCVAGWTCDIIRTSPGLCKCQPQFEACDGKDNDCDGIIDNPQTGCLTVLASGQGGPSGIAIDGTNVYYLNSSSAEVMKVPIGGGTPVKLTSASAVDRGIAVDSTTVYFTESAGAGAVGSVPITGGGITFVAPTEAVPGSIVMDSAGLYWANAPGGAPGAVRYAQIDGGAAVTLAKNLVGPEGLALDALNVYFATPSATGGIFSIPKAPVDGGATPIPIVSGQNSPVSVQVDGDRMFWANSGFAGANGGSVFSAQVDGGGLVTIATGQSKPVAVAIDATYVYWIDGIGPHKAPRAGGGPVTTIAWGQGVSNGIAVDATSVYWTSWQTGRVMKRTPK